MLFAPFFMLGCILRSAILGDWKPRTLDLVDEELASCSSSQDDDEEGLGSFHFCEILDDFCCLPDTIADAKGEDFVWVLFVSGHVASVGALLSLE